MKAVGNAESSLNNNPESQKSVYSFQASDGEELKNLCFKKIDT